MPDQGEQAERVELLLGIFDRIYEHSSRTGKLAYYVCATEQLPDRDLHVDDFRDVRFMVGLARGDAAELSLNEVVALFQFIGSVWEQLAGGRYLRTQEYAAALDLAPTDRTIALTLRQMTVLQPA